MGVFGGLMSQDTEKIRKYFSLVEYKKALFGQNSIEDLPVHVNVYEI